MVDEAFGDGVTHQRKIAMALMDPQHQKGPRTVFFIVTSLDFAEGDRRMGKRRRDKTFS